MTFADGTYKCRPWTDTGILKEGETKLLGHLIGCQRPGDGPASSRSIAARIVDLDQAGTPTEKENPEGKDLGFRWYDLPSLSKDE